MRRAHLSVGDEIRAALVEDGDVAHGGGQVLHQPRVRVHSWNHVLVEDGLDQARELHSVRSDHSPEEGDLLKTDETFSICCSPCVALEEAGVGGQMPEPIGVHHHGDVPGAGALHDDADPAEHALVPPQARAQHHHVQPGQPLVYLLYPVLCI